VAVLVFALLYTIVMVFLSVLVFPTSLLKMAQTSESGYNYYHLLGWPIYYACGHSSSIHLGLDKWYSFHIARIGKMPDTTASVFCIKACLYAQNSIIPAAIYHQTWN